MAFPGSHDSSSHQEGHSFTAQGLLLLRLGLLGSLLATTTWSESSCTSYVVSNMGGRHFWTDFCPVGCLLTNLAWCPVAAHLLPPLLRTSEPRFRPNSVSGPHADTGKPWAHLLASTSDSCRDLALALCPGSSHWALTGNNSQVPTLPTPALILGFHPW